MAGNELITADPHPFQRRSIFFIQCDVSQLGRIVFQVMEKLEGRLVRSIDKVARIGPVCSAHPFPARDSTRDGKELAEKLATPVPGGLAPEEGPTRPQRMGS